MTWPQPIEGDRQNSGIEVVVDPGGCFVVASAVGVKGVYELPAVTTAAITQGAKVYFDATAGKITPTATDNTLAGIAWEAKIQAGTVARVRLG